ncbi:DUF2865 domain-containing protein [Afifella sp. IM 167]|uniref:DUF2865 domain-containing protein n=1 Tax=Afifella sp. IM 167 TaxID=2033586 RepID=UPI001CCBE545|nr:DUF2865 domain-containing protein [Afifella sp. IM 167]
MQVKGRLIAAAIAMAGGIAAAAPAFALSCQTLEVELTRLESQASRPDPRALRYERAAREQARVLDRSERRAEQAGCFGGGFLFFRNQPSASCGPMMAKINEMRANLEKLERMRARYSGGGTSDRRADRIRELIHRQGCRTEEFRSARTRSWGPPETGEFGPDLSARQTYSSRGVYRTLCVRTCDGYYFPISFSTTPDRFAADEQTCQARCPGTQTSLYVQPDPTGDTANMVSLAGEPYSALPAAFQYRQSVDKACTCQASGGRNFSVIETAPPQALPGDEITPGGENLSLQGGGNIRVWGEANIDDMTLADPAGPAEWPAMPQARPAPPETASLDLRGSDPETAPAASPPGSASAPVEEKASVPAESAPAAPQANETTTPAGKPAEEKAEAARSAPGKIRIVGPSYWGGQQKEEVLVAPVRR